MNSHIYKISLHCVSFPLIRQLYVRMKSIYVSGLETQLILSVGIMNAKLGHISPTLMM